MNIVTLSRIEEASVSLTADSILLRDALVADTKTQLSVGTEKEQLGCTRHQQDIRRLTQSVEASRKAVKEPVLTLGKQIDQIAREFVEPLEIEFKRLQKLNNEYTSKVLRERQEAEQKAREEQARIERQRAEEEAELKRKAAAAMQQARNEAERAAVAKRQAEYEAKIKADAELEQRKAKVELAKVSHEKPAGMVTREVWKFEVTDIDALYKAHPWLVKIEPDKSAINAQLSAGNREIPGLKIWSETITGVRV